MQILHTQNDGNCLFEALCVGLHLLHQGDEVPLEDLDEQKWNLRQQIANIICVERREHFEPFCPHPYRIYEDGEWAGEHELVAFADHYRCNITVYDTNDQWTHLLHIPHENMPYENTIVLIRENHTHYNLLCERDTRDPRVLVWDDTPLEESAPDSPPTKPEPEEATLEDVIPNRSRRSLWNLLFG